MCDFCPNVWFLSKCGFLYKMIFFRKMCSFCQNVRFWSKWAFLCSCCQNVHFFVTICAFYVKLFQNFVFPIFEFPKFPIFVLPKFVPPYICVPINGSSCNWFFLGPFLPIKWVGTSHGKYMIIDHKPNQCQLHVFFFCTIFFTPAKICFLQ